VVCEAAKFMQGDGPMLRSWIGWGHNTCCTSYPYLSCTCQVICQVVTDSAPDQPPCTVPLENEIWISHSSLLSSTKYKYPMLTGVLVEMG